MPKLIKKIHKHKSFNFNCKTCISKLSKLIKLEEENTIKKKNLCIICKKGNYQATNKTDEEMRIYKCNYCGFEGI